MKIYDMNWMQVEEYLKNDDRCVLPLGSVEQHGYMSLGVDAILSERVALEAAEPLGIPVFPAVPYASAGFWSLTGTAATSRRRRLRSSGWPTTPATG